MRPRTNAAVHQALRATSTRTGVLLILVQWRMGCNAQMGGWAVGPLRWCLSLGLWLPHCGAGAASLSLSTLSLSLSLSLAGSRADIVTACRWRSLASLSLSLWLSLFLGAFHSSLAAGCHQLSPAVVADVVAAVVSQPLSRHIDHVATVNSRFNRHDVNFP